MCVCLVRFGLWLYNGQLLLALCPAAYNLWERPSSSVLLATTHLPLFAIDSADASAGRLRVHVDYRKSGTDGRRVGSSQKDCAHRLMTISGGFGISMPGGRTDGRTDEESRRVSCSICCCDGPKLRRRQKRWNERLCVCCSVGRTEITFPTSARLFQSPSTPQQQQHRALFCVVVVVVAHFRLLAIQ